MLKYSFKHLVAKYRFLGLNMGYRVRTPSGYEIKNKQGKTLYVFKTRKEAEKKVDELIQEQKVKL